MLFTINNRLVKNGMGETGKSDILEIEIDPDSLGYLKKNNDVFILTQVENPQYSYLQD